MTRILIAYGTTEGQTAKIAEYIADVVRSHGYEAEALNIKENHSLAPETYDGVMVGSSAGPR
jgi:menaquinone-dependent protoporphyrinogen oxidase